MKIVNFLILLIFCIACNQKNNSKEPTEKFESIDGLWELTMVNDTVFDIDKMYGFDQDQPTIKFDIKKGKISGFSGCNQYDGNAKITDSQIILPEPVLATEQGCGGNKWEHDFFNRLLDIEKYSIENNTLKINGKNRKSLTFKRRVLHPLEKNFWELTKVNDTVFDIKKAYGNINEPQPSISFNLNKNRIDGWDGCNSFTLEITFKERYYTSSNVTSNARGCYKDWSEIFYGVLSDNKSYEIKNETLLLKNSKGKTLEFKKID